MRISDWSSDVCSSDLVGLQKSGADDDERQRQPEQGDRIALLPAVALESHQEMAERKQHRTEQHGLALAQIAVRQIAADHRRDVDERGVRAVDDRGEIGRAWWGERVCQYV